MVTDGVRRSDVSEKTPSRGPGWLESRLLVELNAGPRPGADGCPMPRWSTTCGIPEKFVSPTNRILRRVLYAPLALFAAVLIVYLRPRRLPRCRKPDVVPDCLYYATVSLSTTGYGDITPPSPSARLVNVLVITPLRVAFLIVLIGTTVETLTAASAPGPQDSAMRNRAQPHRRHRLRHRGQDGRRRHGR